MLPQVRGMVSDRKWCLLGVAVYHQIADRLDDGSKRVIELCEHYAEGAIPLNQLFAARGQLLAATGGTGYSDMDAEPSAVPRPHVWVDVSNAFAFANKALVLAGKQATGDLVHCVLGNPFRPVSLVPAWLTPTVRKLAQAAYDNRLLPSGLLDNTGLAILADALEEAGCDNADILSHCRGPGPHVRGCWLLDLILNKE